MAITVDFDLKFPDWSEKLRRRINDLQDVILATMQTNRGMLFDREGSHNGHEKWAPLKLRDGQILSDRGTLRKSIAPRNDGQTPRVSPGGIVKFQGDMAVIGTTLKYAAMMNWGTTGLPGGVLRPVKAKALKFPGKNGKGSIFAKSVKIPPRRFDEWNEQDQEELDATITNKLEEILNGA